MNKRFIATALAGLVAVGLTACSPPSQQPSDQKVDTADSQPTDSVDNGSDWTTEEASAPSSSAASGTATASETDTATATAAAGAEEIAFVDCVAEPASEPTQITLDCANPADAVVGIEWASWGEEEAQGTGTNQTTGAAAEVTLSAPEESAQGSLYTVITVDGAQVTQ